MTDSDVREHLDAKHERNREQRIEGIKRWIEYTALDDRLLDLMSEPPETRGPQQTAVVNDQLEAARSVQTAASHQQHVKNVAAESIEATDESDDDSE